MKALTLTQPWASLVAIGAKRLETRSWWTSYRGPLAIHAAKSFPADCRELCDESPFYEALEAAGYYNAFRTGAAYGGWQDVLPRGAVLATSRLVSCCWLVGPRQFYVPELGEWLQVAEPERSFGDYTAGRWAWVLGDVEPLPAPVPVSGGRGLWNWEQGD